MVNISRQGKLYSAIAAILGVIGAILRKIELDTVFEPETGLALRWQPITILLILLSAVSVMVFIILSARFKSFEACGTYCTALAGTTPIPMIISAAAALGIAGGSVLYFIDGAGEFVDLALMLCGLLTAISVFMLSRNVYLKKDNAANAVFSTIIVIFVCLWMVLEYKMRSADPVILDYVYDFLALCSAAVAFYYKAGFAFDRPRPPKTMLFSMTASYFCLVAIPGASGTAQLIFFACLALVLFSDMPAIAANLKEKE